MNALKDYVEWKLTHSGVNAEAEGYPLIFEKCKKNKKMKDLKVYGNSVQEGTPTPENPIEVQSVGELVTDETDVNYGKYKIPIVQSGKNLFKPARASANGVSIYADSLTNSYGTTISTTDLDLSANTIQITQVPNEDYNAAAFRNGYFSIQISDSLVIGKKYTLSYDVDITSNPLNATEIVIIPNGNGSVIGNVLNGQTKKRMTHTFTLTAKRADTYMNYIEIRCMGMSFTARNFMITEEGYDAEFEPYVEPQVHNVFLDEPLRKVGDYADYIDFKNRRVVRHTGNTIFNGTENWIYEKLSYGNNFYVKVPDALPDQYTQVMCNMGTWLSWTISNPYNIRISGAGNFNFRYEDYDNLTDFKNKLSEMYLNNQPLNVTYALKTEVSEDISNQLPKITTKTTVFTVDSTLEPSNMYGKYIK